MGRAYGTLGSFVYAQRVSTRCYKIWRADGSFLLAENYFVNKCSDKTKGKQNDFF
jgi:hypothetical protein